MVIRLAILTPVVTATEDLRATRTPPPRTKSWVVALGGRSCSDQVGKLTYIRNLLCLMLSTILTVTQPTFPRHQSSTQIVWATFLLLMRLALTSQKPFSLCKSPSLMAKSFSPHILQECLNFLVYSWRIGKHTFSQVWLNMCYCLLVKFVTMGVKSASPPWKSLRSTMTL
jgi:hypothetical protein